MTLAATIFYVNEFHMNEGDIYSEKKFKGM